MNIKNWLKFPWKKRSEVERYATFRYESGRVSGRTLTVAGLRDMLNRHRDDTPVFVSWEGVWAYIDECKFDMKFVHKGNCRDGRRSLVIDVNEY